MSLSKLITIVFGIAFIVILYAIIYYALKIMYKDVKSGGKRNTSTTKKSYGIEVLRVDEESNVQMGAILLLREPITIGRKEGNTIILTDKFVSGNHAKLVVKNNEVFIEDLNSTNGIFVNDERISGYVKLRANDKVKIGNAIFKVIRSGER